MTWDKNYKRKMDCKRVCQYCNKDFMARRDVVKRGGGKYCSLSCSTRKSNWKGGRHLDQWGYVHLTQPNGKMILEHRIVASQTIRRPLKIWEIVHHINGNPSDNRPENLQVMSQSEHATLHQTGKSKRKMGWSAKYACCIACSTTEKKYNSHGLCEVCSARKRRGSKLFTPPPSE